MSAESLPITAERFSEALKDLSLSSLYLKVDELRNSIAHLEKSNAELEVYVREEQDKDCYEALVENKEVLKRMAERIDLIKKEVMEVRGLPWRPEEGAKTVEPGEQVVANGGETAQRGNAATEDAAQQQRNGDTLENSEEGVFL